jgi:hypothetical protein
VGLKKLKSQGKAVEVTLKSKEENSYKDWSGFRPRIGLLSKSDSDMFKISFVQNMYIVQNTFPTNK